MLSVLILDDEPSLLELLVQCLRSPGLELVTCLEIEAAEALLSCRRFDAVVVDLAVSPTGGLEGIRLIRFLGSHFPGIAVYVFSAHVDARIRHLCSPHRVTAVLEKPEGLGRLRRLLLEQAAAKAEEPAEPETPEAQRVELLEDFLARRDLRAALQPIVKLQEPERQDSWEIVGVEGLARGPASSLLGQPSFLMSYAAHKQLLFEADFLCIEATLREVRRLNRDTVTFLNVQPRSLSHPEFSARLIAAVAEAGLPSREIVLELTEQQTIVNPAAFSATLDALRRQGFRIALDDYGEGFSNLHLFHQLRPEYLKISGIFCHDLKNDPWKRILLETTAELAARSGALTIMEAVETREDAEVLGELGLDYAQGYFFAEPRSALSLLAQLAAPDPRRPALRWARRLRGAA